MSAPHPIYALASDLVETLAAFRPELATYAGITGHDDRWPDLSPAGADAVLAELRSRRRRLRALPSAGNRWDQLAIDVALDLLSEEIEALELGDHLRDLNSIASPVQHLREAFDHMPTDTSEAGENILARLATVGDALDGYRMSLEEGRRRGLIAPARQAEAVAAQCEIHAGADSALAALHGTVAPRLHEPWQRKHLDEATAAARSAFGEFGAYLRTVYLPGAMERDAVGPDEYRRRARTHLGTDIDPEATYRWGWNEVGELRAAMERVAGEITPGADIPEALHVLKTDPDRAAADPEAFRREMQHRTDDALARLSNVHFDVPAQIRRVEVKLAPPGGAIGAYYVGPSEDFTRAGTLWWSLADTGPVPLFDQVTTAYHEGFPGHHLQVGIQVSLAGRLSRLQRVWAWKPGTGEGWALYAERLMHELGFLDRPDYVFGLLAAQMLRACRVVIDIGSHLDLPIPDDQPFEPGRAWTFEIASRMLETYAALDADYARSEITRYLGWPGQAIAYKVGERAILDVRSAREQRDGAAFDLKAFHQDLLEVGPVGIDVMRRWLLP